MELAQHRNPFTQTLIDVYQENAPVPSHFSSMFMPKPTQTKYVSIEVERDTELISVDVNRLGEGTRNLFSKSSEKIFLPPMHDQYFDATSLDVYDNMVNSARNAKLTGSAAVGVARKLIKLQNKIARAEELQCAQIFETGIVLINSDTNIDYKRKATSKVDAGAGGYWTVTTAAIEAQLIAVGDFFRTTGKSNIKEIDMTLSGASYTALKASDFFINNANFNNVNLNDIKRPIANSSGSSLNGQITAGSYTFNIWSYDETYQDEAKVTQRYMPANQTVFTPVSGTQFDLAYGGLPEVIKDPSRVEFPQFIRNVSAKYMIYNKIGENRASHIFGIRSAPLAVPVTIDRIYTLQTLGEGGEQG